MRSLGPDEVPATNGEGSPRATTWRWLFVTWVAFSIGLVQAFVLRGDSVTTDENSYLFQAHVFSHARLWAPLPPEGRLLDFDFSMINFTDDRWFSRYFLGVIYESGETSCSHRFGFGITRRTFTGATSAMMASLNVPLSRKSAFNSRTLG